MIHSIKTLLKNPLRACVVRIIDWRLLLSSRPLEATSKTAMVFAPHQDDESFGCGGLIALKRAEGASIRVVFLTDGGKSYGWDRMPVGMLAKQRQQEALRALEVLGVEPQTVTFLNQADGELDQLSDENRQNVIGQIVQLLSEVEPEEVYVTYRRDAHADHEVTSQLVQAAIHQARLSVRLMEYPVWSLYKPWKLDFKRPEFTTLYRLPITAVRAKKRQAIVCHRSQYEPIPPDTYGGLPKGFIDRLSSPYEFFFSSLSMDVQKSR